MSHLQYVQSLTVALSACLPTVKPTVIDVGIYVNSIGPVSSIDMVSSGLRMHIPPSPDVSIISRTMAALWMGGVAVSVLKKERRDRWMGFPPSPGSAGMKAMSLKSRGGDSFELWELSAIRSGSESLGETQSLLRCDKALLSSRARLEACFHLQRSLQSWSSGASLPEVQGHRSGSHPSSSRNIKR